jgi:hypothetical protein
MYRQTPELRIISVTEAVWWARAVDVPRHAAVLNVAVDATRTSPAANAESDGGGR